MESIREKELIFKCSACGTVEKMRPPLWGSIIVTVCRCGNEMLPIEDFNEDKPDFSWWRQLPKKKPSKAERQKAAKIIQKMVKQLLDTSNV